MDVGSCTSKVIGKGKKTEKTRRVWSAREEEALLQALKEAVTKGWKSENGFRPGYLVFLEEAMKKVFPGTDLRGNPHINSKIHVWKRTHGTLVTMLSKSGIGWNDSDKVIDATDEAWDSFVKTDSNTRGMRYKPWPYYDDWCVIFGNDRATGENAESFAGAIQGVLKMSDNVGPDLEFGMDEIFLNLEKAGESMSVSIAPTYCASESKQTNSKKRKKPEQAEEQFVDAMNKFTEMTRSTMSDLVERIGVEYDNVNATKDVFDALGSLPSLTADEIVDAAALLADKPKQLTLFFSLPNESRLRLVRKILRETMK